MILNKLPESENPRISTIIRNEHPFRRFLTFVPTVDGNAGNYESRPFAPLPRPPANFAGPPPPAELNCVRLDCMYGLECGRCGGTERKQKFGIFVAPLSEEILGVSCWDCCLVDEKCCSKLITFDLYLLNGLSPDCGLSRIYTLISLQY